MGSHQPHREGFVLKSVSIKIRSTTSRMPSYSAQLKNDLSYHDDDMILGTTRDHATWAAAAVAALRIADSRGYVVTHRRLIEQRINKEGGAL